MSEENMDNETEAALETLPVEAIERDFSWLNKQNFDADDVNNNNNTTITKIERIGFQIADLHLICSFDSISEISDIPDIYRVPHLPPWVHGVASLRGEVAPIIDLAHYLKLSQHTEASMLMVVGHDDERAGLLVNGSPDIYYFSEHHLLKTNPPVSKELLPHLNKAYQQDGVLWLELDMTALIDKMLQ